MATTAFFSKMYTRHNRTSKLGCTVTLKDDGKISITKKWGGSAPFEYFRMEQEVKQLVEANNWTDTGFSNVHRDEERSPQVLALLAELKAQTEPLRVAFIKHSRQYADKQFKIAAATTEQQVIDKRGYDFEWNGKITRRHTKASLAYWDRIRSIVSQGLDTYVEKAGQLAELHYQDSMVKLTNRIVLKGLDFSKAKIVTDLTSFDKGNITTIINDGMRTVRAFTILAWGEIKAPHYRYLIK